MPVPMEGAGVVYDHVTPLFLNGSDADEDIGPIHAETCNKLKTSADLTRIAKTKRQAKKLGQDSEPREPSRIPSRGFEKPRIKKPWPKRPFPKRKP